MNKQVLAIFAICSILVSMSPVSAHKGGDIIFLGNMGMGGMPAFISSGKKKGNILLLGRRKRSVDEVEAQPFPMYKLLPAEQQ